MRHLFLDIETFSSVDIMRSGAYKYAESLDFEILILAYAFDDEPVRAVSLSTGDQIPERVLEAFKDPGVLLHAHNAAFERVCFRAVGIETPISRWRCSAVKAGYCGLPLSLDGVSKALQLGEEDAKDAKGKALIKYFSVPVKPSKVNGGRLRNLPEHDEDKWADYIDYCIKDVRAERAVIRRLKAYEIPEHEQELYILDQEINDRGIEIDQQMARNAFKIDQIYSGDNSQQMRDLTGLDNPGSPAQLKEWLSDELEMDVNTLNKKNMPTLKAAAEAGSAAESVLDLRVKSAKTSIKKYISMLNCVCADGRAHGLFQFYGASRTGRWAGRLIQLQNLPQNHLTALDLARRMVWLGNYAALSLMYDDLGSVLSQLIRTAFVAAKNKTFAVADFSAIEARVIAWLAEEEWRMEVFASHGKIYEASASMMFSVPIETVTKGSDLRQKGKIAELALGYQGAVGALKQMGGAEMGLSEVEMKNIVDRWRRANPNIVALWADINKNAMLAVRTKKIRFSKFKNISFFYDGSVLQIGLPSGRKLIYQSPALSDNKWGHPSLSYMGMDQTKKIWCRQDTYGGKLVENIVQAIARDLLAVSMIKLNKKGFEISMHVHDEAVAEIPDDDHQEATLEEICAIMGEPVEWAEGLPLAADGYLTKYYKKD